MLWLTGPTGPSTPTPPVSPDTDGTSGPLDVYLHNTSTGGTDWTAYIPALLALLGVLAVPFVVHWTTRWRENAAHTKALQRDEAAHMRAIERDVDAHKNTIARDAAAHAAALAVTNESHEQARELARLNWLRDQKLRAYSVVLRHLSNHRELSSALDARDADKLMEIYLVWRDEWMEALLIAPDELRDPLVELGDELYKTYWKARSGEAYNPKNEYNKMHLGRVRVRALMRDDLRN